MKRPIYLYRVFDGRTPGTSKLIDYKYLVHDLKMEYYAAGDFSARYGRVTKKRGTLSYAPSHC